MSLARLSIFGLSILPSISTITVKWSLMRSLFISYVTAVLVAILPDAKAKSIVEYKTLCGFALVDNPYGVKRIISFCLSRIFSNAFPLPFLFPQPHQISE